MTADTYYAWSEVYMAVCQAYDSYYSCKRVFGLQAIVSETGSNGNRGTNKV